MNPESRLVSVVTPSYNKGQFIEETILSIRNQTYPHIEHIVMDAGSTDGTLDILRKYEDRLTWVSEPDKGQADAINKGWKMARGEILAYLNADDTYLPLAVETAVNFFAQNPNVGMVYGNCDFIDEQGNKVRDFPTGEFDLASLVRGPNIISQPTVFFRAEILDEVGYLDTNLHMSMDYDLFIRIALSREVAYIPKLLATYRLCAGSKTTAQFLRLGPDCLYIMNKLFSRKDLPEALLKVKNQACGNAHSQMGWYEWREGHIGQARAHFLRALAFDTKRTLKKPRYLLFLGVSLLGTPLATRVLQVKRRIFDRRLHARLNGSP
jgi:glycosyltransferase involved in cell wall biosynthesis